MGRKDRGLGGQSWQEGVRKGLPLCESCSQNLLHFLLKHLLLTIIRFRLQVYVDPCPDPIGSSSAL